MNKSKSAALIAAVCAVGFGVASAAAAQTASPGAPTLLVQYSPASLVSERGVRQLYGRLVVAAKKVCDDQQIGGIAANRAVLECRKKAVSEAVAQVHNQRLVELSTGYGKIG
jgi:UrcA family protein